MTNDDRRHCCRRLYMYTYYIIISHPTAAFPIKYAFRRVVLCAYRTGSTTGRIPTFVTSLLRIVFAQDLCGFQPLSAEYTVPLRSFVTIAVVEYGENVTKTIRPESTTSYRREKGVCCPGFRQSLYYCSIIMSVVHPCETANL